jgi:hypothetical protein
MNISPVPWAAQGTNPEVVRARTTSRKADFASVRVNTHWPILPRFVSECGADDNPRRLSASFRGRKGSAEKARMTST